MLALRSLLFNIAFYFTLLAWMVCALPAFLLPRRMFMVVCQNWARFSLFLLRIIAGTKVELRGRENIPEGGLLVVSKHQSTWETFALLTVFEDPAFILKRELMHIPFFGWYTWKSGQIPVDRDKGGRALVAMRKRTREAAQTGRQVIIFPEGTRRPAGAQPAYKFGASVLYGALGVPCLPVALNSGLYWPRRHLIRRPGTIVVEFLPVLPDGLGKNEVMPLLQERIEEATNRLLAEGRAELGISNEDERLARRAGHA